MSQMAGFGAQQRTNMMANMPKFPNQMNMPTMNMPKMNQMNPGNQIGQQNMMGPGNQMMAGQNVGNQMMWNQQMMKGQMPMNNVNQMMGQRQMMGSGPMNAGPMGQQNNPTGDQTMEGQGMVRRMTKEYEDKQNNKI